MSAGALCRPQVAQVAGEREDRNILEYARDRPSVWRGSSA
jgi:hypothetical protein